MRGPKPGITGKKYRVGMRYGRLVIIAYIDVLHRQCLCDCGKETRVKIADLSRGDTRSCGCLSRDTCIARNTIHGHAKRHRRTTTYQTWCGMRRRCNDSSDKAYVNYGGRGIGIHPSWNTYEQFLFDMGEKPPGYSLERLNNEGDYGPGLCVWATKKEQARNTRSNFFITFAGKTQTLAAWAEEVDKDYSVLQMRLRKLGWSVERAFTEEVHHVVR